MNLLQYLPPGWAPEDALALLAGANAVVAVLVVWWTLVDRDRSAARAAALAERYRLLKANATAPRRRAPMVNSVNFMRQMVARFNLLRSRHAARTVEMLSQAGWRSRDAVVMFLFAKLCLPLASGGAALAVLYGLQPIEASPQVKMMLALGAVVLGAYAPDLFVKNAGDKRRYKLRKSLPDALDLLVVCAEAGLSLDSALKRVAREIENAAPEMADEFGLTAVELGFLPDRRAALENLLKRTNMKELRAVVGTLLQTEKYGTPLAQALRVLSAEQRDQRMLRAEDKAARLPAMLTVPMVVFILPSLFIVLIGPAILRTIDGLGSL